MGEARFVDGLQALLSRLAATQDRALDQAGELMASALGSGGLVHLFGSGHSVIPVMDAFPRYGSFVGLHPLTDPRLMWWNVLGPGGVRELLWLERTEGYIAQFLAHEPLAAGDALLVFSHSGRNAAPVEAALYARERGIAVIGVTSRANLDRPAGHSSGKRLAEIAEVTIDTGVPVEDAIVQLGGWGRPLAGASTIVACVVVGELIQRTAAKLLERGVTLPTFVSPTVPGASLASNEEVFGAHRQRLIRALQRERPAGTGAAVAPPA